MNDEDLVREKAKEARFRNSNDFFDEAPRKTVGVISSRDIDEAEEYDVIGEVERRATEVEREAHKPKKKGNAPGSAASSPIAVTLSPTSSARSSAAARRKSAKKPRRSAADAPVKERLSSVPSSVSATITDWYRFAAAARDLLSRQNADLLSRQNADLPSRRTASPLRRQSAVRRRAAHADLPTNDKVKS